LSVGQFNGIFPRNEACCATNMNDKARTFIPDVNIKYLVFIVLKVKIR
jgi:hypothetical protein